VRWLKGGRGPRHLLLGPEGDLYVSLSHESSVAIVDKETGEIVARTKTGKSPRSMALSGDGSALYVVNYREDSLAVVDTATMKVRQKIATGPYPIGVAFEPTNERVWVSCYGGSVRLYDSRGAAPHKSVKMILKDEAKRFHP
jgi:YVTN family beta-propeller protein